MNICTKCGTEFDGNFCPECGTKVSLARICKSCGEIVTGKFCTKCGAYYFVDSEISDVTLTSCDKENKEAIQPRICKNCGTVVDNRFCTFCGTEYIDSRKICRVCGTEIKGEFCPKCGERYLSAPTKYTSVDKKYWALTRLPLILFLTLAVLLVIAYFCEYIGGDGWSSNIFDWEDGMSAYLIFFFPAYSATAIVLFIIGMMKGTRKSKNFNLFQTFGIVGIVFMSLSTINGCAAIAVVAESYWNYDFGPASILIMVFSVACLIPSLICVIKSKLLVTTRADYAASEYRDRERHPKKNVYS